MSAAIANIRSRSSSSTVCRMLSGLRLSLMHPAGRAASRSTCTGGQLAGSVDQGDLAGLRQRTAFKPCIPAGMSNCSRRTPGRAGNRGVLRSTTDISEGDQAMSTNFRILNPNTLEDTPIRCPLGFLSPAGKAQKETASTPRDILTLWPMVTPEAVIVTLARRKPGSATRPITQ